MILKIFTDRFFFFLLLIILYRDPTYDWSSGSASQMALGSYLQSRQPHLCYLRDFARRISVPRARQTTIGQRFPNVSSTWIQLENNDCPYTAREWYPNQASVIFPFGERTNAATFASIAPITNLEYAPGLQVMQRGVAV